MRGIAKRALQHEIQAKVRIRKRIRDLNAARAQSWRSDRDKKRLNRFDPLFEVTQPALDDLRAGQAVAYAIERLRIRTHASQDNMSMSEGQPWRSMGDG
jgi:hypothetical protein